MFGIFKKLGKEKRKLIKKCVLHNFLLLIVFLKYNFPAFHLNKEHINITREYSRT